MTPPLDPHARLLIIWYLDGKKSHMIGWTIQKTKPFCCKFLTFFWSVVAVKKRKQNKKTQKRNNFPK